MRAAQTPANIVRTQNTHRQDTPAVLMKPLTIGPSEGPAKGARVKKPSALPRVLASQISEMIALGGELLISTSR